MKQVATLILAALLPLSAASYNKLDLATGSVTQNSYSKEKPQRDVQYVADGIVVTYTFSHANLRLDDLYSEATVWEMPGAMLSSNAGEPALPKIGDTFILPAGSSPTVSLVDSDYADFSYTLAPARIQLFENDTIGYNLTNVPPIAPYSGLMPQNICELQSVSKYRSQPVARITVSPVQYDHSAHKVRAYKQLCYKISYNNADPTATVVYEPGSLLNPNNTLANDGTSLMARGVNVRDYRPADEGYLIISHSDFEKSLQPFIKWKRRLGYKVTALYDSSWTPENIKSAVKSCYQNDTTLTYLLIVGDATKVPTNKVEISTIGGRLAAHTDFPYGCLDGENDLDADIFRGRWPMRTSEEVDNIVAKTIWYEQSPVVDEYFYKTGVHVGYFEDHLSGQFPSYPGFPNPDGIEDRRFVKTCEDLRNYMMTYHDFNISRVYSRNTHLPQDYELYRHNTPKQWNEKYGADTIPEELWEENGFDWYADPNKVENAINDGCSYVLYRGHGLEDSWLLTYYPTDYEIKFSTNNIRNLCNYDQLPLIFSLTCKTGDLKANDSFVREFLKLKQSGAIGVFACSETGYTPDNDYIAGAMFDRIWPNPGIETITHNMFWYAPYAQAPGSEPIYNLGKIMDSATSAVVDFSDYKMYSKKILHCFADPSLSFFSTTPRGIGTVEVDRTGTPYEISVSIDGEPAYISFYDPISDKSARFYGCEATYHTPPYDEINKYVSVVVTRPNAKPYIDMGDGNSGDISISTKSRITGWQNMFGSHAVIEFTISKEDLNKRLSMVVVDTRTNAFISNRTITNVVANEPQKIDVYVREGLMIASLMVDGYPVSNMKMYVTE